LTGDRQAHDAAALLRHLGVKTALIAGRSFCGLIAPPLAVDAQELVHTLVLLKPTLTIVPSKKASLSVKVPIDSRPKS
jgi:pimeloyl-ACP methyl ester carboxylesterase